MDDLQELGQRIAQELSAAEQRRRSDDDPMRRSVIEFQQRLEHYAMITAHLMQSIIRPRMHKIAEYFKHAQVSDRDDANGDRCVLHLRPGVRFPATGKLELAISRDAACETVIALSNPEITPIFCSCEGRHQLSLPLSNVDDGMVAAWVDEQLVCFVRAYLCSEVADQYDTANMTTDPVCGMRINPLYATAYSEFEGQTYYFCREACLKKFVENPRQYLAGVDLPVMSRTAASAASGS
jgi:YHS domain-containing protein